MSSPDAVSHGPIAEALDRLDIDLYRRNVHRVLGLDVGTDEATAQRMLRRRRVVSRLEGQDAAPDAVDPDALDPPPDAAQLDAAGERWGDPVLRFVDQLFWFWPLPESSQGAGAGKRSSGAGTKRITGDLSIWATIRRSTAEGAIACHNLAVHYHLRALDWEWEARDRKIPNAAEWEELAALWTKVHPYWVGSWSSELYWEQVRRRVAALDDPRVTQDVVETLRAALPVAVYRLHAHLAVRAARLGDDPRAKWHAAVLHRNPLPGNAAMGLLEVEVEPLLTKVQKVVAPTDALLETHPDRAGPEWQRVHQETKGLLAQLALLLPDGHVLRSAAQDAVADALSSASVTYGNTTHDWVKCAGGLQVAFDLACDSTLRGTIEGDLSTAQQNAGGHAANRGRATESEGISAWNMLRFVFFPMILLIASIASRTAGCKSASGSSSSGTSYVPPPYSAPSVTRRAEPDPDTAPLDGAGLGSRSSSRGEEAIVPTAERPPARPNQVGGCQALRGHRSREREDREDRPWRALNRATVPHRTSDEEGAIRAEMGLSGR